MTSPSDAADLVEIYAPYVRESTVSFELEPPSATEMAERLRAVLARTPWIVCEQDGRLLGYAYATRFRARPAYDWTVETAIYVARGEQRRGIAAALYGALLDGLRWQGFHVALGVIALPNAASVALHERFGFLPLGVIREAGFKFGAWRDSGWWQLALGPSGAAPQPLRALEALAASPEWQRALQAAAAAIRARRA